MQHRPGIEPDGKLAEGGTTGNPTNSNVEFTAVSSCLTFTVFYEDGTVSAGHIGMVVDKAYQNPDEVVQKLQAEGQGKQIHSIAVVGEMGLWGDNSGHIHTHSTYNTMAKITQALNPGGKPVKQLDTDDLVGGRGGALIEVSPHDGKVIIKNDKGVELGHVDK